MTGAATARGEAGGADPVPRLVGQEEAGALAPLHAAAFPVGEAWGPDALRLMLEMPGAFALRLESGFVMARAVADEAEVLTLAVHPAARRRGLGGALVAAAAAEAARRGAAALFLEVSEANAPARALYAALGCGEVGRRRRYYADGSDALVLRLPLEQRAEGRLRPGA
ncbi:GNAT family N-acetyltransferase [Roseomonas sp. OT10]|uniref:GNAT family N-acetyltransferase n=1 Tax=Roseomonas cutis TaxID=2897332 RepID=UPI001E6250A3|nr:GNAT family N-acetyltransferase [Roseomonas sp. OT10]UFN48019.1 GNAT family N-acetyltransferase [Roseomonas sp. OT10]